MSNRTAGDDYEWREPPSQSGNGRHLGPAWEPAERTQGSLRVSVQQLRQRWGEVLRRLREERRTVIITRRGHPVGVFLPFETYNELAARPHRRTPRARAEAPMK